MILVFVEDAGAANFLTPVIQQLFNMMNAPATHVIASGKGSEVLHNRGITFQPADQSVTASPLLDKKPYSLVVTGTSENPQTLGLQLIDEARRQAITSIGVVDGPANARQRFSGADRDAPLKYAPDWVIVADEFTRQSYVKLGFCADRIAICGHPAYERSLAFPSNLHDTRENIRSRLFPGVPQNRPVILFAAETSDGLDSEAFKYQKNYKLKGSGKSIRRTDIVLDEVLSAIDALPERPYFILRLHPKNTESEFIHYRDHIDQISHGGDPLLWIYASDLVVGLSSIILDEAAVMGRPSLSVLPRTIERGWLAGIEKGWVRCVTNYTSLQVALTEMISPKYSAPPVNDETMRGASALTARFIFALSQGSYSSLSHNRSM